MNTFYPISLNLNNKLCIIVGGGKVAFRKANKLLASGAIIKVLSPTINPELQDLMIGNPKLSWHKSHYIGQEDLYQASLVFATTDNPSLNQKIWEDANTMGIFANMASNGGLSDFIVPSSFNQGNLQISVSTSGKVPGLSKAIKEHLEQTFSPEYKILVSLLEDIRSLAITKSDNKKKNRYILSDITANYLSILEDLDSGIDPNTVRRQLLDLLK